MQLAPEGSWFDPNKNRLKNKTNKQIMEYESDRTLIETKLEEVKRLALLEAAESTTFVASEPDPKWVKPAPQPTLPAVGIEEAQGFWINGGKTGGKKDEPASNETFDHDLPNLEKNGSKELPAVPNTPIGKLTAADTDKLIKARNGPTDEDLANMLNVSLLDFYKGLTSIYDKDGLIKAYNGFHSG